MVKTQADDAPQIVAEVRDYDGLISALRDRANALGVAYESVDAVAGIALRYTAKLFAPVPVRSIGKGSLGPLLGALGLKLIVAIDAEAVSKFTTRLERRTNDGGLRTGRLRTSIRRSRAALRGSTVRGNSHWGRVMRARAMLLTTPQQRSAWARQAALALWRGRRLVPRP